MFWSVVQLKALAVYISMFRFTAFGLVIPMSFY